MRLRFAAALLSWFLPSAGAKDGDAVSLYINYSPAPKAKDLLAYDVCILDPHSQVDLKPGLAAGRRYYAYMGAVEVAKGSPFFDKAQKAGVPFVGDNPTWQSRLMDLGHPAWMKLMLEEGAAAVAAGYTGFFFDTVDAMSQMPDVASKLAAEKAFLSLVREIQLKWPKHSIIINRGFTLLVELKGLVHGVLVESVYQSYDFASKKFIAVKPPDSEWVEAQVRLAQQLGYQVYAVDYVSPIQAKLAAATAERLRKLGCIPLVTTPELRGRVLAQ